MPCYHPLHGYQSTRANPETGKYPWVARLAKAGSLTAKHLAIPCGRCIGCRLERSRQWAIRCVHEASLHEDNAFITLTYAPENIPPGGTLKKNTFKTLRNVFEKNSRGARSSISIVESTASSSSVLTITRCCSDLTSLIRNTLKTLPEENAFIPPRFCPGCGRPVSARRRPSRLSLQPT